MKFVLWSFLTEEKYIPCFPKRVYVTKKGIYDETIEYETELNSSALAIFECVNNERNMAQIIGIISEKYQKDKQQIGTDVWNLMMMANQRNLINMKLSVPNVAKRFIASLYSTFSMKLSKRHDIEGRSKWKILKQVSGVIACKFIEVILMFTVLFGVLLIIAQILGGEAALPSVMRIFAGIYCFLIGCIVSITVHETLHIYCYRKYTQTEGGYLVTHIISYSFKRKFFNHYWIILSGIVIPVALGVMLYLVMFLWKPVAPFQLFGLAFATPFVLQLLNLLPFQGDGRAILQLLFLK